MEVNLFNYLKAGIKALGNAKLLLAMLSLMLVQFETGETFAATYEDPYVDYSELEPNLQNESRAKFTFMWFNREGSKNYYYTVANKNHVKMLIDGVVVADLTEAASTIKHDCQMFNGGSSKWGGGEDEANTLCEKENGFLFEVTFSGKNYLDGRAIFSNPFRSGTNNNFYYVTVEVILQEWNLDYTHKIEIVGDWKRNGAAAESFTLPVTISKPKAPIPTTAASIKRTGNKTATYSLSNMTRYSRTVKNGNNTVTKNWRYSLGLWKTKTADTSNSGEFWGWAAVSSDEANAARLVWFDDDTSESATEMSKTFSVPSNWEPFTVYPRTRMWMRPYPSVTTTADQSRYWEHAVVGYNKNYGAVTLPGYPRPKNLVLTPNQWTKSIKLTWGSEVSDTKNADTNGKWAIFRAESSTATTQTLVKTINYSETEFEDTSSSLAYDKTYYYWVAFVPNDWNISEPNKYSTFDGLYVNGNKTLTRSLKIDPTISSTENSITVKWTSTTSFENASASNTYTLKLLHGKNTTTLSTTPIKTWTINSPDQVDFEFEQTSDLGNSKDTHYYQYVVNAMGKEWKSAVLSAHISGESVVEKLSASRGDYAGAIKLTWQAKHFGSDPCYYKLSRRPLGSSIESDWRQIYSTSGTANSYSYDDNNSQPGNYYEYKVESQIYDATNKTYSTTATQTTDGFSLATGVISGRVTYGSGTAVEDTKISLKSEDTEATRNQFYSMYLNGKASQGIQVEFDKEQISDIYPNGFTVQMWVKPDAKSNFSTSNSVLYQFANMSTLNVKLESGKEKLSLFLDSYKDAKTTNTVTVSDVLPCNQYSHITLIYSGSTTVTLIVHTPTGTTKKVLTHSHFNIDTNSGTFTIGNIKALTAAGRFKGYVDDVRIWNNALTEAEVEKNYTRVLSGSEKGLALYWPMDEGITNQTVVYDYSKSNGVSNGRHGKIKTNTTSSQVVPSEDQLSLYALTDSYGNYVLRGIPFNGDGTNYKVIPTKGTHNFNPELSSVYICASNLVHSGMNFTDISSFNVSGQVLYTNTTYPVEGVAIYVDGSVSARDGEMITTDAEGKFTVSVPIGEHYISVQKTGHTFTNFDGKSFKGTGYYPSQIDTTCTNMVTKTFVKDMTGLTFFDNTLVPVLGRVVGGDIENSKPLGLNRSTNNIGQAVITLNAGSVNLNADKDKDYAARTTNRGLDIPEDALCASTAYVGSGTTDCQNITIKTDPESGEFAVMLPPLKFKVTSVVVPSNQSIKWSTATDLDCSETMNVKTDSAKIDTVMHYVKYVASLKKMYRSDAVLDVTQAKALKAGAFGADSIVVLDNNNDKHPVALYDKTANFSLPLASQAGYTFGYPVFQSGLKYKFNLKMYEQYVNNDKETPKSYEVPLSGLEITINNRMSDGTAINIDPNNAELNGTVNEQYSKANVITLDSTGCAVYQWTAGMPNIQGDHTFAMDMTYQKDSTSVGWVGNGFKGIVLGSLTTGTNFVTGGPDKVSMILRDPCGSNSYSWIEEGQTTTTTTVHNVSTNASQNFNLKVKVGMENTVITGTAVGGVVATSVTQESAYDVNAGFTISGEESDDQTTVESLTTTKRIQTSEEHDFVGAVGDVFIGTSTNYTFGKANEVGVFWNAQTNKPEVGLESVYRLGSKFGTSFSYTQNYIENVLIPNFISMRNSILEQVPSYSGLNAHPTETRYVTTLDSEDPNFGTSNNDFNAWGNDTVSSGLEGPSYHMILPDAAFETVNGKTRIKETFFASDTIRWYNQQISMWQQQLYNNEKAKVTAIEQRSRYLQANYSFDAGASVESSVATLNSEEYVSTTVAEYVFVAGFEKDFDIANCGLTVSEESNIGHTETDATGTTTENTMEIGFALVEEGDDDALTVDVLKCPDGFGPIFYTRGGQTSAPYEDAVVTKYYRPGYVISAKTMQIEVPQLTADVTSLSGVPSGKAANFTVKILNNSETGEDCWFNLSIVDTSNPNGADVLMDGYNITNGRTILVPAGTPLVKTIQVKQTNTNIYDYENLILRISSLSQPDDTGVFPAIADELPLTVHFQKASSDVDIELDLANMNIESGSLLKFAVSGYDKNAAGLQKLELQYQRSGDVQWTTAKAYTVAELDANGNFEYVLDMSNTIAYPDGEYNFRGLCTSLFGNETVTTASEVITIYKDMARPRLMSTISPSDGILNAGDDIILTFNEDIRDGEIRELDNFILKGELNEAALAHDVAANFTGAAAKTASRIDLKQKSFAVDMWLKYAAGGKLFAHGSGSETFVASVNANNKLEVAISGNTYTSTEVLQPNTWMFVSIAYDAEAKTLSAHYAYDAFEKTLFNNFAVNAYSGYGNIQLGEGLTGQMHDVALYDNARTWIDAMSGMYKSKSRYTQGLIGYWRMNEGHGTTASDIARSRTMTMPSANSWYLEKTNYALVLENNLCAGAFIGNTTTLSDESYLVEFWFRADASNNAVATIMALSNDLMDLRLTETGALELMANEAIYTVSKTDYRDGNWHHLALNVLKSTNGNATVYVDGNACKSVSASAIPALQASHILFGGRKTTVGGGSQFVQPLKGGIDEIRVWKGFFDASVIRNNMYNRVDNDDESLIAYYPFEYSHLDEGAQTVQSATVANRAKNAASSGPGAELEVMSGSQAASESGVMNTTKVGVVGLKSAPVRENVNFSFTASERQLRIELTDVASRLENCTVNLTVKGIRDVHGNMCENITWDLFVRQNQLLWVESSASVRKIGEEAVTFTAEIMNEGNSAESWSLVGMPEWLSANAESGTLAPQASRTLTFTVDPSLSAGRYDETIFLVGSKNISEPLNVSVVSLVEAPDWSVNGNEYELNMNMIARLMVDGNYSEDDEDIVAAFNGETCVGVAKPYYVARFDSYYLMLTIYGNATDAGKALQFKVFDASTGIIYPTSTLSKAITFTSDGFYGSLSDPVIVSTTNEVEQTLNINKGWTWTSFFLDPTNSSPAEIFGGESGAGVAYIKSKSSFAQRDGNDWDGGIVSMTSGLMYKLRSNEATNVAVIGQAVNPAASTAAQRVRKNWNWLGYTNSGSCSLNAAFADLNPMDDDVVKSQSKFAVYSSGEWIGNLSALVPGAGYEYYSNSTTAKNFNYPVVNAVSGANAAPARKTMADMVATNYAGNMTIIAVVMDGNEVVADAVVMAVDDALEMRGVSEAAVRDDIHFLTVGGNEANDRITFIVTVNGMDRQIIQTINFSEDAMMGTLENPYVLQLDSATGIENLETSDEEADYNLYGQKIKNQEYRGIRLNRNKKVLE